jgi:trans-aconitate 2-methyltransferase
MTAGRRAVDWDAKTYDRVASPQEAWGREVIARTPLDGDETVLDAGCGSGRVTRLLLERLPRGRVIGVDASSSMIELARAALPADRVSLICGDLLDLALDEPVDVAFSNATFHWVPDHRRLFERLAATIAPGGRLAAQCGGRGNVEEVARAVTSAAAREPFAQYLDGGVPWHFAGAEETEALLEAAGFADVRCWLERKATVPEDPRAFGKASGLAWHIDRLPEDLHEPFLDYVMEQLGEEPTFAYVRLNIEARRPQ